MSIIERISARTMVAERTPTPSFPKSVKIEVTSRCNMNCSFCATSKGLRKHGDMSLETFERVCKDCVDSGVEDVGLFLLGESLVLPNLERYCEIDKKVGAKRVFLTTNGILATPERVEGLVCAGLDSLKFSIGTPPEDYRVIQNLLFAAWFCSGHGVEVSASSVFDPDKAEQQNRLRASLAPYIDSYYCLPQMNQAGHMPTGCNGNPGTLRDPRPIQPCWVLFNTAHITWDGHMTACCFDHDGRFKVADLFKTSVKDAWNCRKFTDLRAAHLSGKAKESLCERCLG